MKPDDMDTAQRERIHDAFISYSRRDRVFAARLEKALENYRPPREVRATGRRLSVFRDEADFSGTEYDEAIARHLKGSAKLIVVCSPNARSSAYVADEIRRFAVIHGTLNIVPVLIEGLPNNEAGAETEARKAFPEVLCELFKMPVASDYRGWVPGKERIDRGRFEAEWFKTLASLLDQEPAVVQQRERMRRARSLRLAFSGAAIVIAVLTAALVVALISRREAVFQRAQVQTTAAQADFELALMYRRGSKNIDPRVLMHLARALRTKPDAGLPRQYLVSLLRDVPWHLPLGAPMRHEREVLMAAFSPDGRQVVTASADNTARLWDAASGEPIGQPMRHRSGVLAAMFNPDGTKILTRSEDGTARMWSARTAEPVGEVLRHQGPVLAAAFSPNERWIVTGGTLDQTARLWDAQNGQPVGEPLRHQGGVGMAVFTADSQRVFTASFGGDAQFWEVPSGRPLERTRLQLELGTVAEALSPDGLRILARSVQDDTVRILDALTGQPVGEPLRGTQRLGPMGTVVFTAGGYRIAAVSIDGTMRGWDSKNGKAVGDPLHLEAGVTGLSFSPSGNRIITVSSDAARLRDARTGEPVGEPLRHEGRILNAALSPDGSRLVTASVDGKAQVWSAESGGQMPLVLSHNSTLVATHFPGTGDRILTATSDGLVRAWAISTGRLVSSKRHPLTEFRDEVWETAFSPDGSRIVMGFKNTARIWEFESGHWVGTPLTYDEEFKSVSFSPDGSQVIAALSDQTVRVWDVTSGQPVGEPLRHEREVARAAFSPDGRWIVTTCDDTSAWLWNGGSRQLVHGPLRHPHEPGLEGSLEAVFDPESKQLVTAWMDGTMQIWSVESGRPIGDLLRHEQSPLAKWMAAAAAAYTLDGQRIATVAGDKAARIWNTLTGYPVNVPLIHASQVEGVAFSKDGRRLVTESEEDALVWDVAVDPTSSLPPWLPELAEALAGNRLDESGRLVPPSRTLIDLRQQLLALKGDEFWSRLGRWFFTHGPDRAISPTSNLAVRDVAQRDTQPGPEKDSRRP